MCNDENEDDESDGDQGGHGTPPTYTPTKRRQRTKTDSSRPRTDTPRSDVRAEMPKSSSIRLAEGYIPSIKDLRFPRKLNNGFTVGRFGGKWCVFDDCGNFIGKYKTSEIAEKEAFKRKEPPSRSGLRDSIDSSSALRTKPFLSKR